MATRFEPLKLTDPRLFGVRLQGAFARGDRQRLLDLASRCLETGKSRLVLDCEELDSLGGGGAGVLADLQRQLVGRDGEAVFVAAGAVIRRFLEQKFAGLPLRFFDDVEAATAALTKAAPTAGPAAAPRVEVAPKATATNGLDALLDDVDSSCDQPDEASRRTADLMTAAYVSLDDTLLAAGEGGNPTVLGEALTVLLDSQNLAAETIYCYRQLDRFVSADGEWQLPCEGGVVSSLMRTARPLTLLDLEDGDLWDEETQLLEDLCPDLILPLIRGGDLFGIVFLQHRGEEREFGLTEVFALELLQRLLAAEPPAAMSPGDGHVAVAAAPAGDVETLLRVKLELARGLQGAQDIAHFWQVFIARLRLAAEVTSLVFIDTADAGTEPFLAGEARRGLGDVDLGGERIRTFFRTLERPVEVINMPASFRDVRDALLSRGVQWLVGLRTDDRAYQGAVALGLHWRCVAGELSDQIHEVMEIAGEALFRLRENQQWADMSLGLVESLLLGGNATDPDVDDVSRQTVAAVRRLAREMGLPADQQRELVLGALLRNHGQGDRVFDDLAADQLAGEDWEVFRAHPDLGVQKLASLNAPAAVRDAVRHHHERFDGRGFPLGLQGRDIPLVARLVAVAQTYALHLVRTDESGALAAMQSEAGKALDPDLVEIFEKAALRTTAELLSV